MSEDKLTFGNSNNDDENKRNDTEKDQEKDQTIEQPADINQESTAKDSSHAVISADTEEDNSSESPSATSEAAATDHADAPTDQSDGESSTESTDQKDASISSKGIKGKLKPFDIIRIICIIGFVVFSALFVNEVIIQPYRIKKSVDLTRELYNKPTEAPIVTSAPTPVIVTPGPTPSVPPTPTPDPNRDEQGRLLQFKDLLAVNEDVKGWLTIPDTNVDYVVVQASGGDQDYYLDKDIEGNYSKAGTLFLDSHGSVENQSQNLVIHGHNMVSTAEKMFHYLLKYKNVSYYKKHPVITFDTIYETGKWKIFAVIVTNGSSKHEKLFDYTKGDFANASEFLNFVYQLRIRSVLNIDSVDITDDDRLLMLSTCSYEVDNYRTVVIARKVRDGEDPEVDVDQVSKNKHPLYPDSYYDVYGGEAPKLPATFEEALSEGSISWYTPPEESKTE